MDQEGLYVKWNKQDRERQILHVVTYMWNLKKKKKNSNSYKMVVASSWEVGKWGKFGKRVQSFSYKINNVRESNVYHGDYSW